HVARGIDELLAEQARLNLFQQTLAAHQSDLIGLARVMRNALEPTTQIRSWPRAVLPDDWESKRLAAALREHLARSPLWKQWDDWVRLREVALADLLGRLDLASAAASRSDATKPATDLQVLLQRHTEALLWPGSGLDMRAADIPVQSEE